MGVLGIDFGTSHVRAVAASRQAGAKPDDVVAVPAAVSFDRGRVTVGAPVLMMAGAVPDVVVVGLKRLLGRTPSDPLARRLASRGGYALGRHGTTDLGLLHAEDQALGTSVVGACADLLRHALDAAGAKGASHDLVVAVPSWFGAPQREALVRAAALARLRVRRFVGSNVATALWAARQDRLRGRVAIIDVGAGGIDVTIVHIKPGEVRLLGAAGSADRGGDDVDAELATAALAEPDRRTFELVRQACESLKRELSKAETAKREVSVAGSDPLVIAVERWELGLSVGALVSELGTVLKAALAKAELSSKEIDAVAAVGGMAALEAIRQPIGAYLNKAPTDIDLQSGPALGAAVLAAAFGGARLDLSVSDGEQTVAVVEVPAAEPATSTTAARPIAPNVKVVTRRKEVARHRPDVVRRRRPLDRDDDAQGASPDSGRPSEPSSSSPLPAASPAPAASEPASGSVPPTSPAPTATSEDSSKPTRAAPVRPTDPGKPAGGDPPSSPPRASQPGPAPSSRGPTTPASAAYEPARRQAATSPSQTLPHGTSAPHVAVVEAPASPPPARPARDRYGGTRYPARDGHAKYPMRDRDAAQRNHPPRAMRNTRPSVAPPPPSSPATSSSVPPSLPFSQRQGLFQSTLPGPGLPTEGTLTRPTAAGDILGLAITRPLRAGDLEPIAAPVLLRRVLARRTVFGTLELRGSDYQLDVDIEGGAASLTLGEHTELMNIFQTDTLKWRLRVERAPAAPGRDIHPLTAVALEGLRRWLRGLRADELEEALSSKRVLAPGLGRKELSGARRLGLTDRERRFVERDLDGSTRAEELAARGGLGPATCYQLLVLLDLYGLLSWTAVEAIPPTELPPPPASPAPDDLD